MIAFTEFIIESYKAGSITESVKKAASYFWRPYILIGVPKGIWTPVAGVKGG